MPRTVQCPECGVVLNVPDAAAGRRLKCPKCGNKFAADGTPMASRPPSSSGGSGNYGRGSSMTLPTSGHGDFDLPTAPGSLREQFDIPLLGEDLPTSAAATVADPMALFKDDPPSRRKPLAAEGRARARRCPTCGGVVPQGMSICSTCGLDLETGTRVDLMDELDTVPGPARPSGPPIGVWIVGSVTIAASLLFAIISLLQVQKGETGYLFLLCVCLFGIFAAIQFLRSKSFKLLMIALTLGVMVNVVALMILPVFEASTKVVIKDPTPNTNSNDDDGPAIVPPSELLDTTKLGWGIVILVAYFGSAVYLNSPPVRRYFR